MNGKGGETQPGQSVSEAERFVYAAEQLRMAEKHLAKASTQLGKTERKGWWYDVNKLYHGSIKLAEVLEGEYR